MDGQCAMWIFPPPFFFPSLRERELLGLRRPRCSCMYVDRNARRSVAGWIILASSCGITVRCGAVQRERRERFGCRCLGRGRWVGREIGIYARNIDMHIHGREQRDELVV